MLKQTSFILLFLLAAFNVNAAAQTQEGTLDVRSSALLNVNLPDGAMRIKDERMPKEITELFDKSSAPFRDTIRLGKMEVLAWGNENFNRAKSLRVMNEVETRLKNSGWEIQSEEQNATGKTFLLVQDAPRRVILVFFIPGDRIFVFAMREVFPVDKTDNGGADTISAIDPNNPSGQGSGGSGGGAARLSNLTGKWESPKLTNTTLNNYGSMLAGDSVKYNYEFFADGSVAKTETAVSVVGACWTESVIVSSGKPSVSDDKLTINFTRSTLTFNASCEKKYQKQLPARAETNEFRIKEDSRRQLCLTISSREVCMNPAS